MLGMRDGVINGNIVDMSCEQNAGAGLAVTDGEVAQPGGLACQALQQEQPV